VIDAIAAHRVTHLFLPPTALYGLLAHPDVRKGDYSSLLYFTYGAAPTSTAKIREAVEVFGPCMQTLFGQVEAPASCTCLPPWELVENGVLREDRLASCGRRMLLTQVEIMDDDGCLLPAGQPGEIVVQGNLVMRGYYKNEAATAEVSVNGWHHTGDIGYFNDEGYLFIVDRKKDMIISGGFNIYPSEIEQVLSAHPDVHQCAVIGIPDDKWGEAVHAVVQLKPGARADAGELIAAMKDKLGSVKAPKGIDFVDELPRTGAGKISKKDLRARYWEGVGRNI
jgi:acyl-CoA synthetase (AMP-forming)/AMP-acid ligase II